MELKAIIIFMLCAPLLCSASTGAVHVRGRLMCSSNPYANEKVQVWDPHFLIEFSLWSETQTDESGYFSMKASGNDWSGVDPFIWIPNYCASSLVGDKRCTEGLIQLNVPKEMISKSHFPNAVYDIGTIQLYEFTATDRLWISSIFGENKECRNY
ncbi:hypothetical protein CAEBREN_18959 [Caenorhabditis brenneri]|uniref:Uncharacterized protein n=1 Tax=Caenorhabditis brenneri TaxID=135651 RepID=G0N0K2_CAEBE|nr:hypothetical protein CAEBREN_18959 [Caenorhabditis brenneri]